MTIGIEQSEDDQLGYIGLARYADKGMYIQQFVRLIDTIPF
jgi:hypothetical protein